MVSIVAPSTCYYKITNCLGNIQISWANHFISILDIRDCFNKNGLEFKKHTVIVLLEVENGSQHLMVI